MIAESILSKLGTLIRAKSAKLVETSSHIYQASIAYLRRLKARADPSEFEQAVVRAVSGVLVLIYLVWYVERDGKVLPDELQVLKVTIAYCIICFAILVAGVWSGHRSEVRRYAGIALDNLGITYFMMMMGEAGTFMFGLYLFVTFGNGFRYGRRYLHISQAMGLAGFTGVLIFDQHWAQSLSFGIGCLFAMLILPFYVGVLATRITAAKLKADEAKQKADEANKARGRFLANVSHEMRTPLNGVIAMADVLRETSLNDSQREIVDTLGTSAHLLLAQIEDVLDMAKIDAGRVQIENQPFDLGRLLTSSVKVVVPQARYKGIAVNTEIAAGAARWFYGDSHHLRQVLLNLLSNAVKFTEKGEIVLRVQVVAQDSSSDRLRIEVQDTGIGIPQSKHSTIFEAFTQADDSITRVYGGTGLGTAIAKQLVTLMGGDIGVSSTVGVGSVFWVELPLHHAQPAGIDLTQEVTATARLSSAAAALAAQEPSKVKKIRGARILVAEDNKTNQRVTQMILESGGHIATIVENGEAALNALERGGFDLALFDLSMPVVSGLEALKLYRYSTQRPIPILILSANVTTDIIAECQQSGCAEFLPKPIRATTLLDSIERHLALTVSELPPAIAPPRTEERPSLTIVDTPAVDAEVLADLGRLSADPTFVERLLRGFRSDTERLVRMISDGLSARRYEDVKDAAHALKGGAGSVGAVQLVQLAIRFEKATHDTLRAKSAVWTEELIRSANVTLVALDKHLDDRRQQSSLS